MDEEEKVCPLLSIGQKDDEWVGCIGNSCAWFSGGFCAILCLGGLEDLSGIEKKIGKLRDTQ